MEELNNYYNDDEGIQIESNLPISQPSGENYQGLVKINQIYLDQLLILDDNNNNNYIKKKKKYSIPIPYNDMKVLNSLLKENFHYLTLLLKYKNFQVEFNNLYTKSIEILNILGRIGQSKVDLYQKCQKLKFMELKFQNLRINGRDIDYTEADALLDEMERMQYDPVLKNYLTELDIGSLILNRALVKFCLCDFNLAKEYGLKALDFFDKINKKNNLISINNKDENDKYIQKLAQVHEFLAELYDLEKDYKNAFLSYEKCYYLYLGRYGYNHPLVIPYKKKKESYERKESKMKYEKTIQENRNVLIDKLKSGKIYSSKGRSDTFSFIIPKTEINEPLLVKIYALPKYSGDEYFTSFLFLKNICFDKNKLFNYLGYTDKFQHQNYMLYTDEALAYLLENITLIDNKYITFTDNELYSIFINC